MLWTQTQARVQTHTDGCSHGQYKAHGTYLYPRWPRAKKGRVQVWILIESSMKFMCSSVYPCQSIHFHCQIVSSTQSVSSTSKAHVGDPWDHSCIILKSDSFSCQPCTVRSHVLTYLCWRWARVGGGACLPDCSLGAIEVEERVRITFRYDWKHTFEVDYT